MRSAHDDDQTMARTNFELYNSLCVFVVHSSCASLRCVVVVDVSFACNNRIFYRLLNIFFRFFFISLLFLCSVCLSFLFVVFVSVSSFCGASHSHKFVSWLWLWLRCRCCIKIPVCSFRKRIKTTSKANEIIIIKKEERTKYEIHENKGRRSM